MTPFFFVSQRGRDRSLTIVKLLARMRFKTWYVDKTIREDTVAFGKTDRAGWKERRSAAYEKLALLGNVERQETDEFRTQQAAASVGVRKHDPDAASRVVQCSPCGLGSESCPRAATVL